MSAKKPLDFSREDIKRLSYLNWEKDGYPQGHADAYWLEAEQQVKATWRLLVKECAVIKRTSTGRGTVAERPKARITIKISARSKGARG
jgi:hypothetical protein